MPLTVLICAIWLVTCALSSGFSGSWLLICATSSLRKRSSLPASLRVETVLDAVAVQAQCRDRTHDWPICKVFINRLLAVFMTSRLFWYEREAEIMLTISSTVLTLLCVT